MPNAPGPRVSIPHKLQHRLTNWCRGTEELQGPPCSLEFVLKHSVHHGIALLRVDSGTLALMGSEEAHEHILLKDVLLGHDRHPRFPLGIADVIEAVLHVGCADLQIYATVVCQTFAAALDPTQNAAMAARRSSSPASSAAT